MCELDNRGCYVTQKPRSDAHTTIVVIRGTVVNGREEGALTALHKLKSHDLKQFYTF